MSANPLVVVMRAGERLRRAAWAVAPVLIFLTLTLVLTFPLVVQAGDHLRDDGDSYEYAWAIGFGAYQLTHDPLHLFQGNIFYPFPLSLAYSDSVVPDLILGTPLVVLTGNPVFALNLLFLLTFFLSGWGMHLLVRERTGSPGAALVAGVVYAFNPYFLDHLEQLPNVSVQWAPFALWCFERYLATGRSRWAAGFVGATVLQTLVSFYYAFILGIGIALYVGVRLAQSPRAWLRPAWILRLLGFGLLGVLAILPFVLPYFAVQHDLGLERSLGEAAGYAAWPANYLASTPTLRVAFIRPLEGWLTSRNPGLTLGAAERHLYPGVVAVVLAVVGLAGGRRPRVAAPALCVALGFLLSLGPTIHLSENHALTATIPSPYTVLYASLPGFAALRVPARFAGLVVFGLALLAGEGVARILRARWARRPGALALPIGCALLAGVEAFGGIPLVPVRSGAEIPPVYRWLATRPIPSPVVELPIDDDAFRESPRSYYSTVHHQPLVDGFRSFTPPGYPELASTLNTFPSPAAIAAARQLGARYVVVHGGEYAAAPDPPAAGSGARPVASFGADRVYAIDGPPSFPGLDVSAVFSGCPSPPGAPIGLSFALTSRDGRPYLSFPPGTRSLAVEVDWRGPDGSSWAESATVPVVARVLTSPATFDAFVGGPPRPGSYTASISVADAGGVRGRATIPNVAIGSGQATGRADGKVQLVRAALPLPRPSASTGLAYELVWKVGAAASGPLVAQVNAYDAKSVYWSYRSGREARFDRASGCSGALLLDAAQAPFLPTPPPGRYSAEVVLIDPATGSRVPFVDPSGAVVTHVDLGSFWIRPPNVFGPGERAPTHDEARYDLGGRIALLGWDVTGRAEPGAEITVGARWQDLRAMDTDYTAFVHLSDASGRVIAQFDGQPTGGLYPTSAWLPGETVVEAYHLRLPSDLPAGPLELSAGFYDLKTLDRLPVRRDGQPGGSEIPLGRLEPAN